ncbi:MAG: succinylglutamate desuccinylase/aspartoacylase family protein [bacterium]
MNLPNYESIYIGSLGAIPISIPIIKFGQDKPKNVVVTGLHGGEESGLQIMSDLIKQIPDNFKGELILVPSGSPVTQAFKSRWSPIDAGNPNRQFPGSDQGNFSARNGAALAQVFANADLVIDLHCFSQDCAFTGIFVDQGSDLVKKKSAEYLQALQPDVIWKEKETTPDGLPSTLTVDGYCRTIDVPSFTVEMPRADQLEPELRTRIVESLKQVLFNQTGNQKKDIPVIVRQDFRANESGLFTPLAKAMDQVESGQVIGKITSTTTLEETEIKNQLTGLMFLIARPGLIRTGDKMYSIGIPQ